MTFKVRADPRITPVGAVIRWLALDELPQFVNVLKAQMTHVGRRTVGLPENRASGEDRHARWFDLRPGLTGLWRTCPSDLLVREMVRKHFQSVTGWLLRPNFDALLASGLAVLLQRGA